MQELSALDVVTVSCGAEDEPCRAESDALGYTLQIERHAIGSASTTARYIAAARDQRRTS